MFNLDDDDDSLHCHPRLKRLVQIVPGLIVPVCIFLVAVQGLVSGQTIVPSRRGPSSVAEGPEGIVLALAYLAGAAFLHFHFYWRWSERLEPHSAKPWWISFFLFICLILGLPFFMK